MSSNKKTIEQLKRTLSLASRGSSLSSPQPEKDKRKKQRISLPFLPQRLSSPIPDESVSNLGSSLLDLSTPSRPREVWANMSRVGSVLDEKQTVNYVTTHYLFPKCKFLNNHSDMEYSKHPKSICQYVIDKCNVSTDTNQEQWWHLNKKHVKHTLANLRSNKAGAIRWAFYGKLLVGVLYFCWMDDQSSYS